MEQMCKNVDRVECNVLTIYDYIAITNAKQHAKHGHAKSNAPNINVAVTHANTHNVEVTTQGNKPVKINYH